MVDKALIGKRLERAEHYLRLTRLKKDPGVSSFIKDSDLQSIILFNLIQAIHSCIAIGSHIISDSGWETPLTQAEVFEILASKRVVSKSLAQKMIKMVGFRNRIVHEYEKTDMRIVHTVWRKHSKDIESFCKAVVKKYAL